MLFFLLILLIVPNTYADYQLQSSIGNTVYCLGYSSNQAVLTSTTGNCAIYSSVSVPSVLTSQSLGIIQCSGLNNPCVWNQHAVEAYIVYIQNNLINGKFTGLYQLSAGATNTSLCLSIISGSSSNFQVVMNKALEFSVNGIGSCIEFSLAAVNPPPNPPQPTTIKPTTTTTTTTTTTSKTTGTGTDIIVISSSNNNGGITPPASIPGMTSDSLTSTIMSMSMQSTTATSTSSANRSLPIFFLVASILLVSF